MIELSQLPPPAAPAADCPTCQGDGLRLERRGELAHALVCTCVPPCLRCRGTGRVVVDDEGSVRVGRCACQRLPDRLALFNRAAIPNRYARATLTSFAGGMSRFDDMSKMPALQATSKWLQDFDPRSENPGLFLYGDVGRGKTHLLVGLVRALALEKGVAARFVEFSRLLGMLKEGFTAGDSGTDLMSELAEVPVLAIDELGKGRMTDWELTVIDEIISRRYNGMRCTLATTNYEPAGPTGAQVGNPAMMSGPKQTLGDRVGERVWSRVREMGIFVSVQGKDFRDLPGRRPGA